MYIPHQIFERRTLLLAILSAVCLVMCLFFFFVVLHEYRGFGKTPQNVDLTSVDPPSDINGRWVAVTQSLNVHCEPVEMERELEQQWLFGRVASTYFLAEIPSSERVVFLEHDRAAACRDVQQPPLVGVLTELNPRLRSTLEGRGMVFPRNCQAMLLCPSCGPEQGRLYLTFLPVMLVLSLWLMNRSLRKYQHQTAQRDGIFVGSP